MKWEKVKIASLCDRVISGGTPKSDETSYYADGTIPWLRTQEVQFNRIYDTEIKITENGLNNSNAKWIKENSVIVAMYGNSAGRTAINKIPLTTNQACCNLEINSLKADYNFVYYKLLAEFEALKGLSKGAAQNNLNANDVKEFPVTIPPLPTQRKIASILSAYDDLIENNLKRIKLLEEKAFASYKLLVNSEKLIEGKVGDLADVKSGYAFKSRDWSDEGFSVIKIKNIGNNDIDLTGCSFIPENIAELALKFKLNAGDLLIAMTGATVGKIGMMPKTETSFYLNQRVGIFKPKVENSELFLFCFFNEPSAKNAVESLASGAAQPNISGSQLESIKLYYPKLDTVTEFGNSIKSHFELIWNLKEQNTKLREARDILLPKLMNGQIEV